MAAPLARDALVAAGVVVNALAIEAGSNWRDGRRDFARALRAKLVREIAGLPAIGAG